MCLKTRCKRQGRDLDFFNFILSPWIFVLPDAPRQQKILKCIQVMSGLQPFPLTSSSPYKGLWPGLIVAHQSEHSERDKDYVRHTAIGAVKCENRPFGTFRHFTYLPIKCQ